MQRDMPPVIQDTDFLSSFLKIGRCDLIRRLYQVDHSPLLDEYRLYCDSCPNSVEISYYDPVCLEIDRGLPADRRVSFGAKMAEIERRLRLCCCGGHYRYNASRRCYYCQAEVIIGETGVDLWPTYYDIDADDDVLIEKLTPIVDAFVKKHIRQSDIWK